jgi:topoisomerase IA-like protein
MDLRVKRFGLYIKANKENCGLEEKSQVVYIDSMASLLKEDFKSTSAQQKL